MRLGRARCVERGAPIARIVPPWEAMSLVRAESGRGLPRPGGQTRQVPRAACASAPARPDTRSPCTPCRHRARTSIKRASAPQLARVTDCVCISGTAVLCGGVPTIHLSDAAGVPGAHQPPVRSGRRGPTQEEIIMALRSTPLSTAPSRRSFVRSGRAVGFPTRRAFMLSVRLNLGAVR